MIILIIALILAFSPNDKDKQVNVDKAERKHVSASYGKRAYKRHFVARKADRAASLASRTNLWNNLGKALTAKCEKLILQNTSKS